MNYSLEEKKLIFKAIRFYQMNHVPLASNAYKMCDSIMNGLFDEVTESSYKKPIGRPGKDLDSF
jgi:hypothetical protein